MDGVELAVLYTLQHGLTRDPEDFSRFLHRHVTLRGLIDKAISQLLGKTNLPRCARCDLLPGNESIVKPSMDGRRCDAQDLGRLFDVDQLAVAGFSRERAF